MKKNLLYFVLLSGLLMTGLAQAKTDKPNILVIWGDDIGTWNLSAYNLGSMGFQTPNIDRIAREGALFTDYYGENPAPCQVTALSPRTALIKSNGAPPTNVEP